MSEPPPGAVLMTNSTGLVGCAATTAVAVAPAAVEVAAGGAPVPPPPHAVTATSTAPRIAKDLRTDLRIPTLLCCDAEAVRPDWSDRRQTMLLPRRSARPACHNAR